MTNQPGDDRPTGSTSGQQPPWAAPQTPQPGAEHAPEHTQEIPAARPTQEIPRAQEPVWTQPGTQPAYAPSSQQPQQVPPIGPPSRQPKRRGWLVPAAVGTALLVGGGGIAVGAALSQDDPKAAAAVSSSATSDIGTNTAPAVDQASAVAPDWVKTASAVTPSVVSLDVASSAGEGEGSGVIIDEAGHIVTNNHVASGAGAGAKITVTLSDQRAFEATVVGTDPSTDLAVVKLTGAPDDLKPVSFGKSSDLKVGQPVMAVGNPLGLSGTVTTGIVSALNRPVTTSASDRSSQWGSGDATAVFTNAIQTSAAINPGNSGGALVDASGRLIGINSSIASLGSSSGSQSGNIGIGFAIPVDEVTSIAKQLIANGKAEHAYLGVQAPTGIVKDGDGRREAAVIAQVYPNTPASAAGLKSGDAIISMDGTAVTGYESLISRVFGKAVGDKSTIEYIRDGKRAKVEITFTQRPAS